MAKPVYCDTCGMPLKVTPLALPKKGKVVKVVSPHPCDQEITEEHIANITDSEELQPGVDNFAAPEEDPLDKAFKNLMPEPGDQRSDVKSTAPKAVQQMVKGD